MAGSHFESQQYTSESFVESAGGRDECVLPKGRRNCGETYRETALREVTEETGFACRLLPVNMDARMPPAVETEQQNKVKIIWWFVLAVDEQVLPEETMDDILYMADFYSYTDVLNMLTFQMDRDIVKKAIELVENTYTQ
ncbi:hypothetical protein V8C34DRAFT_317196 [Trichoderma compactum]